MVGRLREVDPVSTRSGSGHDPATPRSRPVPTGRARSRPVATGPVATGRDRSGPVGIGRDRSRPVATGRDRSGPAVGTGRVRSRPVRPAELVGIGEVVWRAADTALAALATGHRDAQQEVVRREEAYRREFVDDLFSGRSDVGSLVERAEPFGLSLQSLGLT